MPTRLAFLEILSSDRESVRAAVLVTDPLGDPIEFRTTSPIKPTAVQKALWGRRLSGHVTVSVLAAPLLDSLVEKPTVILARHRSLLELRPLVRIPVVVVGAKADEPGARPFARSRADEPIYLIAQADHQGDLDVVSETLAGLAAGVSPIEPFNRIAQAAALTAQDEQPGIGG